MTIAFLLLAFGATITVLSVAPGDLGPAPRPARVPA